MKAVKTHSLRQISDAFYDVGGKYRRVCELRSGPYPEIRVHLE